MFVHFSDLFTLRGRGGIVYIAILLAGCTQSTLQELEADYLVCTRTTADCSEALKALEQREALIEKRAGCQLCRKGLIDFHDDRGHAGCMTAGELREAFGGMFGR